MFFHRRSELGNRATIFPGKAVFTTDCLIPDRSAAPLIPTVYRRLSATATRNIFVPTEFLFVCVFSHQSCLPFNRPRAFPPSAIVILYTLGSFHLTLYLCNPSCNRSQIVKLCHKLDIVHLFLYFVQIACQLSEDLKRFRTVYSSTASA